MCFPSTEEEWPQLCCTKFICCRDSFQLVLDYVIFAVLHPSWYKALIMNLLAVPHVHKTCTQNVVDLLLTKYLQRRSFNVEAYLWLRFICCFVRSINKSCFKSGDDFTRVTRRVHFSELIWIWLTYCTCKCHYWSQTNASLYYNFSTRNLIRSNIY